VLIGDDHAVLRAGLRALINAESDMVVLGEAADGKELLRLVPLLMPDVILLDLTMPEMGGLEVLERLSKECPHARVLVVTMHSDPAYFRSALAAGARGYVAKRAADQELLAGIRAVFRGQSYADLGTTKTVMEDVIAEAMVGPGAQTARASLHLLSDRERQALALLARGHSNRDIAERLHLSVKTIETYRARIYAKLGIRSRAEIVSFAVGAGLMTPERLEADPDDA
jgi:DNA-binding NarL/FixJ family response regulator